MPQERGELGAVGDDDVLKAISVEVADHQTRRRREGALQDAHGVAQGVAPGLKAILQRNLAQPQIKLGQDQQLKRAVGVDVDPALIATYSGAYTMEDEETTFLLTVATEDDVLRIGFGEEPSIRLFPLPSGRFIMPPANYEFSFEPDRGRATMHVTEESMRRGDARDIVGERRDEVRVDAALAEALVGTYWSREVDAFYRIEVTVDGAPAEPQGVALGMLPGDARDGRFRATVSVRREDSPRFHPSEPLFEVELEGGVWNVEPLPRVRRRHVALRVKEGR